MKVVKSIIDLIGKTPMVEIEGYEAKIFLKLESFNPASCVKERVAAAMIEDAIADGKIDPSTILIEPTSGNTGIGLAMVAACKSLRLILTMPESMSLERRKLLSLLGAELVLTPKELGMKGAIDKAYEIAKENENSYIFNQFNNPSNPQIHYETTGQEIIEQMGGKSPNIFISAVGTGGTITGVGKALREVDENVEIIAVEPADSPVISGGKAAPHKLQGIGAGFIPENLDLEIINEVVTATYEDAVIILREFASTRGILMGISSAAALWAAIKVSKYKKNRGKSIVVLLPDSAERYLSSLG
ncbi:MAG: cysteine synthase A [Rikenellaceae bacterium]